MPIGDKDIRMLFALDGKTVRWKEVPVAGLPALFMRAAQKHNQRAGRAVDFWAGGSKGTWVTSVAGVSVTEARIRSVLAAQAERDERRQRSAPEARPSGEAATPVKSPEIRAAQRVRHIKLAMGFVAQATGEWLHPDGRTWHGSMLTAPEALAAGQEFEALGDGNV